MKIAFVSSDYHWESYSVLRSIYETAQSFGEVAIFQESYRAPMGYHPDYVFLTGNDSSMVEGEKARTVRFGLSDPNLFNEHKAKGAWFYCTNDYNISKRGYYHFPIFCDPKYFQKKYLQKQTDILFVGLGTHPFIKDRIEVVNKLRDEGFRIKVFGEGWPEHPDNHGFIKGPEFIHEINKANLMLDLSNETTALGSRILQASCCGVPVITFRRHDIQMMFTENSEILLYSNYTELFEKLSYFVDNRGTLALVGEKARQRCLREHTIKKRIDDLFKRLEGEK
jgi:spore maturation protein CgeB